MNRKMKIAIGMFCTSIAFWTVVYYITAFVIWELFNPFQWLIDLPTYEPMLRASILFGIVMFWLFNFLIWSQLIYEKVIDLFPKRESQERKGQES